MGVSISWMTHDDKDPPKPAVVFLQVYYTTLILDLILRLVVPSISLWSQNALLLIQ